MKYHFIAFLFLAFLASCNSKKSKPKDINSNFEKSFKEQDDRTFNEHIDSISNIYSNYKYNVAYDGPDKWKFDTGVGEHTIYRTFEPDSAITFSINVIEVKRKSVDENKDLNIWSVYQENKEQMDNPLTKLIEEQLNTKVEGFQASKAYLKNNIALRRTFNYVIMNLDYEYSNTSLQYQVLIDNLTFTFSLDVPTMFFEEKPFHYEELFNNVYFLKNGEKLNHFIHDQNQ